MAEQLERVPAQNPGPPRYGIPDHQEIYERVQRGEKVNPLEAFIFENEPAGKEDERAFCEQLAALIRFLTQTDTNT